jgi:beta-glucanase (GH16 family)
MISSGPPTWEGSPPRFALRYGYVEARLRLPAGQGLWPAFWLLPVDRESRPEIDVVEVLGDSTGTARFHYHYLDEHGVRRSLGDDWRGPDLAAGWHRFAVDWRPGSITWIVDGRARWRVRGPRVSDEPMYLVLNLAVGGIYPGPPGEQTRFPTAVEADWIRVWRER